jgi:dipeptidyl-peptidase-4
VVYQETDERHIPPYTIVHQGSERISVETHRYPFAGAANAKVRLGVVPARGGETRWLDVADPKMEDDFYLARVGWQSPMRLLVQLLSRDQTSLRLYRVEVDGGEKTLLVEQKSPTWVNLNNDLRVVEATGEIVWSSERTGYRHLELYDRDGKMIRALTSGEWAVDGVVALDQARREVWFAAGRESPLESHLYRVSLDGGEIVRVTDEPGIHRAAVARDGEHFVDVASTRATPPVTTLRDRMGKFLKQIDDAKSDARVAGMRFTPPVVVDFKNRDGTTLFGAYYAANSKAMGERPPLVVIVYGGPHVQTVTNSWTLTADLTAQFLTECGFAVWKADNRGSARRGHAFEAAVNRHLGGVEVRDQEDGVAFVAKHWPDVDTKRVGVTGSSYGGYMTLRCLTLAPEVFKAGVSVAPVTDWDGYDTCYTERYMGTPAGNPEGYRESSVLTHAGKLRGHLLVIHGMLDENVHFRHTARLTTSLITAARPFALLPLPDERHSSRREADRKYVAERIAEFFETARRSP